MAKILVVTSGLTGIFNATTQLISLLEKEGHTITSASPRQDIDEKLLPFSHVKLKPLAQSAVVQLDVDADKRGFGGIFSKYLNKKERRKIALDQIEPTDFLPLVEDLSLDLILVDMEMHEYIFQSYSTGIPTILLNQFFSVWTSSSLPDIKSSIIAGKGFKGSTPGMWLSLVGQLIRKKYRSIKMSLFSGGVSRKEILILLAKKLKFPLENIGYDFWPGPFIYNNIPVLNMTLEALDFPHQKRRNMHYIGPMVNLQRKDGTAQTIQQYSLEGAFEKAQKSGSKIIYCSLGTMKPNDTDFFKKLVDVMRDLPAWILILSLGKYIDEKHYKDSPDNVFTFSSVPQLTVLSKASMAIVHGGIHTINECIMMKVPMLVYSGKKSDQDGNTARLIYHNLAYSGDRSRDSKEEIKRKILELDKDMKIKEVMNSMRLKAEEYIANKTLIQAIKDVHPDVFENNG